MWQIPKEYRLPLGLSLALHVIIIVLLIVKMPAQSYRMPGPVSKVNQPKIVQATALNQTQVAQQVKAIQRRENAKQLAREQKLRKLQAQARSAQRAKRRAQVAQRRAQVAQRKAQQRRKQELVRLKTLRAQASSVKQAKLKEQQRIAKLQAKQKQLRSQASALEAKRRAEQIALAKQREQALERKQQQLAQKMMQQQLKSEQNSLAKVRQQQMAGVIDQYKAAIQRAIGQQWVIPEGVNKSLSSQFLINLAPGGAVLSVRLLHSSGNQALDRSAKVAILKASPLPVPGNPAVFDNFRALRLTVSPKEIING